MQFKQRRELKHTKIEIIPMIDTIFFLLVFFMLSSLALVKLNGLQVNLPQASTAPKQAPSELTVTLDKSGRLFVNSQFTTFDNYSAILLQKAGGAKANLDAATLIINADTSANYGAVVKCIDLAREVGITHFAMATASATSGGATSGGVTNGATNTTPVSRGTNSPTGANPASGR